MGMAGGRGFGLSRIRDVHTARVEFTADKPLSVPLEDDMKRYPTLVLMVLLVFAGAAEASQRIKALIIDGQNNHGAWPKTTVMMKSYLEETGLFTVDVDRTAYTWRGPNSPHLQHEDLISKYPLKNAKKTEAVTKPRTDPNFKPDFSQYDVVVPNFGWMAAPWPDQTKRSFERFVANGGGLVIVHAANNSFGDWEEYNKMIGLGGWGGRNEKHGPYVYFTENGKLIRDDSPGIGGSHGPEYEFQVMIRDGSHPITKGMPGRWMHAKDELYNRLRGPAQNMNILATAFSDSKKGGTGRHEPMMMTVRYGKGRVFHTAMGHADYSQECVGFIVTFQRGTEWAATGRVTQTDLPKDFPSADKSSKRKFDH